MRILIVEDDPAIAANLYDYLEARGHGVDAAPDGVSGLNLASAGDFDCILLDVGLPRMDGLALCRRLSRSLGGDLRLGRSAGAGACFELLLPTAHATSASLSSI